MNNRKPRILGVNESHFLNSGYSKMAREILSRLHKSGKYEICELGAYGHNGDQRAQNSPWTFMGNLTKINSPDAEQEYNSHPQNQFGRFAFQDACLIFKPDHVFGFQDPFQNEFLMSNPYRDYYYLHIEFPVDAAPQMPEWLYQATQCDTVLTYTKWAQDQIKGQAGDVLNIGGIPSPAADYEIYKPYLRDKIRNHYGIDNDAIIIGTTMRNQSRKLFSDLFEAFSLLLSKAPTNLRDKLYLYVHSSYPDQGFEFPLLLEEYQLSSKVLFTYKCRACNSVNPMFFQGGRSVCKSCGQYTAYLPNNHQYLTEQELAGIYNLFDVYVQYACAEGFGIPVLESSACGVQTFCTNYSAMQDFPETLKAFPIKIKDFWREAQTGRLFAIPDENDFVDKVIKYLQLPKVMKDKRRFEVSQAARNNYSWDKSTQIWMDAFDSFPLRDPATTWYSAPKLHQPPPQIPPNLDNANFIKWCIANILGKPNLINSYYSDRLLRDLNTGYINPGGRTVNIGHKEIVEQLAGTRQQINTWEQQRIQYIQQEQQNV